MSDDQTAQSGRHWRYQPVYVETDGEDGPQRTVTLCECYFDADDRLTAWTEDPAAHPQGEGTEELTTDLTHMLTDAYLWQPVPFSSLRVGMTFQRTSIVMARRSAGMWRDGRPGGERR